MDIGEVLLYAAVIAAVADIAMLYRGRGRWGDYGKWLSTLSFLFVLLATATLTWYFLTDNFQVKYVFFFSNRDLAMEYKLSALWAGQAGSLLLFVMFLYLFYWLFRWLTRRREERSLRLTYALASVIALFFLLLLVFAPSSRLEGYSPLAVPQAPNKPFEMFLPPVPTDGAGLNPLLRSFWMVVHPPIVFIGYAAIAVPCALALSRLAIQDFGHEEMEMFFMEIAWIFLGLGILIGGLWAYEVLGWGGYWAWDPVETASLIPWIAVTAYLHAKRAFGPKSLVPSTTAIVSFILVVFATWVTRSGVIASVHAFAESPIAITFEVAMIVLFGGTIYLYVKRRAPLGLGKPTLIRWTYIAAFTLLATIAVVCTVGIVYPVIYELLTGATVEVGMSYYNLGNLPFGVGAMYAGIAYLMIGWVRDRMKILLTLIGATAVGVILAAAAMPLPDPYANFGLPLALLAAVLAVGRGSKDITSVKRRRWTPFITKLLHFGVAVTIIGVLISSTMQSGWSSTYPHCVYEGGQGQAGNIKISVTDLEFRHPYTFEAQVSVAKDGAFVGGGVVSWTWHPQWQMLRREPLIVRTLTEDIYIIYDDSCILGGGGFDAHLLVKTIPGVSLVWLGGALLSISIIPTMMDRWKRLLKKA